MRPFRSALRYCSAKTTHVTTLYHVTKPRAWARQGRPTLWISNCAKDEHAWTSSRNNRVDHNRLKVSNVVAVTDSSSNATQRKAILLRAVYLRSTLSIQTFTVNNKVSEVPSYGSDNNNYYYYMKKKFLTIPQTILNVLRWLSLQSESMTFLFIYLLLLLRQMAARHTVTQPVIHVFIALQKSKKNTRNTEIIWHKSQVHRHANEFQISSLTELFDSFGDSTLYKLHTAIKAWCVRRDNDCSHRRSQDFVWGALFAIKVEDLF